MQAQTVGIIGLKRMGASIGLALKASPVELNIVGYDPYSGQARKAKDKYKAIDNGKWSVGKMADTADILILTGESVDQKQTLETIGGRIQDHTLVIDLTGQKADGQAWAKKCFDQGYYIGGHIVLAADKLTDTRSGIEAAQADLFHDSIFCLSAAADLDPQAIETAVAFGRMLGSSPYFLEANEFDSLIQGVETVPGLLATAMFTAVENAAGGRDMLRFAGQSFAQIVQPLERGGDIADMATRNQAATIRWMDALIEELMTIRGWVVNGDTELMSSTFSAMSIKRDEWLHERTQNEWEEGKEETPEMPGIMQHLFGNLGKRK